jgi:hypothetical protein
MLVKPVYITITTWGRDLLEKLMVAELVKQFPVFYGTRSFFTVEMTFWDVEPCNLVELDRRFRGVHTLRH